jgi:hypothetical protein
MCEQRERLIGYVYDECDAAERAEVQRHLDACAECRDEIASLRSVREDLLTWDVPDHESVWKPFAPAPAVPWWQQIPRWAFAAAASVVVVSGAVGGALAHAMMPHSPEAAAARATEPPAGSVEMVTASDLSAAEQRMLTRMQEQVANLDSRVRLVSTRSDAGHAQSSDVAALRRHNEQQMEIIRGLYNNLGDLKRSVSAKEREVQARIDALQALVLQQAR